MAASTALQVCLTAILGGCFGDEVDNAANGIGTIHSRAWATDILDALDIAERDLAEIRRTCHHGGNRTTIHQNQRVVGVGSTDKKAADVTPASQCRHLHTGQGFQQIRQTLHLTRFDLGAIDHHNGSQHRADWLFHAVGRDDQSWIDGDGSLGKRRRRQQGSRQKFLRHERSLSSRKYLLRGRFLSARNTNSGRSSGSGADSLRRRLPA